MHKYKLERFPVSGSGESVRTSSWVTANPDLDDEDTSWLDSGLKVYMGF